MRRHKRRTAALLVVGAVALATAVAGYAYWTSTGVSTGSAATAADTPWQINVETATGGPLTPGGAAQQVRYTVTNTSSGDLTLNGVTVSVADAGGSTWSSGNCTSADFLLNGSAPYVDTRLARTFTAGEAESATVTVQLVDNPAKNQNDCKNISVPLYFAAS